MWQSLTTFPLNHREITKRGNVVKQCSKCKEIKEDDAFTKDRNLKSGLSSWCKKCKNKVVRLWKKANPERVAEEKRRYFKAHPEKCSEAHKRARSKPHGRLNINISNHIRYSLRCGKNGHHWETLVGYTVSQLKKHIEKQFKDGMSWDNYGKWHLDHKIPISKFNFEKPLDDDFKRCWALKNLQPLWALDNMKKHCKIDKPTQTSLIFS